MTKSEINRLGKKIRHSLKDGQEIDDESLLKLQSYRTSFKKDLTEIFKFIAVQSKKVRNDSLVSFRIKRIESILSKILREPTMSLGNMGDIAGCRVVLYSEVAISSIVDKINKNFTVKNFNDYTNNPKPDGYKGYHLYVHSPLDKSKLIEIQLRLITTHRWASFVEIIDILFDLKLKEGQKHKDLQEFLLLLSLEKEIIDIDQKKSIIEIDMKYKIYSSLNQIFLKNHLMIRQSWLSLKDKIKNNYYIFEIDSHKKSKIYSFEDYESAENKYFEMFLEIQSSNFVLAYVEKANFNKIVVAYASYIMVKHGYIVDWRIFLKDLIIFYSKEKEFDNYIKYFKVFQDNIKEETKYLKLEIEVVEKGIKDNIYKGEDLFEWLAELRNRIKESNESIEVMSELQPKLSYWEKIIGKKTK